MARMIQSAQKQERNKTYQDLEFSLSWRAGKRNDVFDALETSHEHQQSLKAQTKARMRNRSILAKISVPPYVGSGHTALDTPPLQDVEAFLSLGPSNELSDLGHKDVHSGHGGIVVVEAHVEGLDSLGVVVDDGGTLIDLSMK